MKFFNPFAVLFLSLLLFSCKAMNKTAIHEENFPADIGNKQYKILFTTLNFQNSDFERFEKLHNKSAEEYLRKKFKGAGEFINESELKNNNSYADIKIYRYVLINKISHKLEKKYTYGNSGRPDGQTTSFISAFTILDRETGKVYNIGSSTSALWMFKGIIDKMNAYF